MVVIFFPPTADTGVTHERVGVPSRCTVQAPHSAMPQPNLVPVRPTTSRSTQSKGISGDTSTVWSLPLIFNVTMTNVLGVSVLPNRQDCLSIDLFNGHPVYPPRLGFSYALAREVTIFDRPPPQSPPVGRGRSIGCPITSLPLPTGGGEGVGDPIQTLPLFQNRYPLRDGYSLHLCEPGQHRVEGRLRVDIHQDGVVRHFHFEDLVGKATEQYPRALVAAGSQQAREVLRAPQHGISRAWRDTWECKCYGPPRGRMRQAVDPNGEEQSGAYHRAEIWRRLPPPRSPPHRHGWMTQALFIVVVADDLYR